MCGALWYFLRRIYRTVYGGGGGSGQDDNPGLPSTTYWRHIISVTTLADGRRLSYRRVYADPLYTDLCRSIETGRNCTSLNGPLHIAYEAQPEDDDGCVLRSLIRSCTL